MCNYDGCFILIILSVAVCISSSVKESIEEVASSRIKILGLEIYALKKDISCLCPEEGLFLLHSQHV